MTDRTYPALPEGLALKLRAIEQLMEFDPNYLTSDECPYSTALQGYLRRLFTPARTGREDSAGDVFTPGQDDNEQADSLIREIQNAINSMKRLQQDVDNSDDVGDRLNFLKNFGSLMDRFLSLKEKAQGIKQMFEFQRVVIQTMEQVLDKDGRLDFKKRLKEANLSLS